MWVTATQFDSMDPADLHDREVELADLVEQGQEPDAERMHAYHPGHRVYLTLVNADGEPVLLEATDEICARMRAAFAGLVGIALAARGVADGVELAQKAVFSPYTGCDCGCSRGFLLRLPEGSGLNAPQWDLFVTLTVTTILPGTVAENN